MYESTYYMAGTQHALPIFRTLGVPSGFIVALGAVLTPCLRSPERPPIATMAADVLTGDPAVDLPRVLQAIEDATEVA